MFGFVVGLTAEARIAAAFGCPVRAGGGTAAGAQAAAIELVEAGASGLVSFGLAGGLDPALRPGTVIVPSVVLTETERLAADPMLAERFGGFTGHTVFAAPQVAVSAAAKRSLFIETRAHAVDLESGAVAMVAAAYGVPFVVVRAVCDPAWRDLPPAAMVALDAGGRIGLWRVLRSVAGHPRQIWGLSGLARDAGLARRALVGLVERFGAAGETVEGR